MYASRFIESLPKSQPGFMGISKKWEDKIEFHASNY